MQTRAHVGRAFFSSVGMLSTDDNCLDQLLRPYSRLVRHRRKSQFCDAIMIAQQTKYWYGMVRYCTSIFVAGCR